MKTKILIIILLIISLNVIFSHINKVQALTITDVFSGGDDFVNAGESQNIAIDEDKIKDTSNVVYNILLIIGMAVAVIIASILGIKFMIGSIEEKAQIKESLIPFIIGCVVVFGAFGIWKIFIEIGNNL